MVVTKMNIKSLKASIEAILFSSGDPVSIERIAQVFDEDKKTIRNILEDIIQKFNEQDSGIRIMKYDDEYQMCSSHECGEFVRKAMDIRRNVPLSEAAMEVLAIVAYNQPVTKAFIEQIRGVDCSGVLSSLITKKLIEEQGRLELPGRPLLYGTSTTFLNCFKINNVNELPSIEKENLEQEEKSTVLEKVSETI